MNETQGTDRALPLALLSFLLGVASLFFLILTGLPAMFLGLTSLRAINAADGRRGRGLAIGGMVLGAVGTLATIVGVVVGALLLIRAKESKQTCQNNLRTIGAAVNSYATATGRYPRGTDPSSKFPQPEQRLSWMVTMLPDLSLKGDEKKATPAKGLFDKFDTNLTWDDPANSDAVDTLVRSYLCPAYPENQAGRRPAPTDYIGLGGVGLDSPEFPLRGADHSLHSQVGFFGYDRELTDDDVQSSVTLMATETTLDNGAWAAGGRPTVRGIDTDSQPYIGAGRQFGGMHSGGAFFLYVDGSALFFNDKMDREPLEQLVRLRKQ